MKVIPAPVPSGLGSFPLPFRDFLTFLQDILEKWGGVGAASHPSPPVSTAPARGHPFPIENQQAMGVAPLWDI